MEHSISKQIKNDYFTLLPFIGIIIFSLFLIGAVFFGIALTNRNGVVDLDNEMKLIFGIIFGILVLLCVIAFIYRIYRGNYFVKNGLEIDAEIIDIIIVRDRGRIEYSYKIEDKIYKKGNGIHKTKTTEEYKIGDKIKILIDPKNNKKTVIKNHFIMDC
jgi:cbb3-type cytochrome oxidase subunit 3